MTLKEAIEHARKKAKELGDCECARDHAQLAEWLEELQALKSPESATIVEGWVAVDTSYNGLPHLHTEKPHLEKLVYDDYGCYDMVWVCDGDQYMLDPQLFPNMTPKSEPKKCRITITPIEDE